MSEHTNIQVGNAAFDNDKGWFIGGSVNEALGIRHTYDVELKWSTHKAGEERPEWVTKEVRKAVAILISGKYEVMFRDQSVILAKQGDFVMWDKGIDHKGRALEDSVLLTVRWPSIPTPPKSNNAPDTERYYLREACISLGTTL